MKRLLIPKEALIVVGSQNRVVLRTGAKGAVKSLPFKNGTELDQPEDREPWTVWSRGEEIVTPLSSCLIRSPVSSRLHSVLMRLGSRQMGQARSSARRAKSHR